MTRHCHSCGLKEARTTDDQGRAAVNLDPVSGLCVACLVQSVGGVRAMPEARVFDARMAQAGTDGE